MSEGVDPSGPHADVSASFSEAHEETTTSVHNFSVRNVSDGSMTGWEFYYTAMDGDNWVNHYDPNTRSIKPIANLAKSTLTLNAEGVYKAPAETNKIIPWQLYLPVKFSCLALHGSIAKKTLCIQVIIDFISYSRSDDRAADLEVEFYNYK